MVGLGAAVVACWYLFVLVWTDQERLLSGPAVVAALGPLAGAVALAATNRTPTADGLHALVWTDAAVAGDGPIGTALSTTPGPAALALDGYPVLLVGATATLLVSHARAADQRLYRWQHALLVVGPLAAVVFGTGFALLSTGYRPHPFAYVLAHGFVVAGVVYVGSYDVVSVPRESLVKAIDGGVLVYSTAGRVVDLNGAAQRVLSLSPDVVGAGIVGVVEMTEQFPGMRADGGTDAEDYGAVADRLDGHEFTAPVGGESRTFLVRVSELTDDDALLGWTVLFYDVTRLRRKQRELNLLKQVLSRVLRHNVRNDLSVVKTNAEELAADAEGLAAERVETILEKSDDLLDASEKARAVERLVDSQNSRADRDLVTVTREAVAAVEPGFPGVDFETALPDACAVRAHPALSTAVENLVENGAAHNEGDEQTVAVTVDCDAETATLTVADDGPGVPYTELNAIESGEETQLEHGSGVGLWLVDWILGLSAATVEFENTDRGCTVRATFDRATGDGDQSLAAELGLGVGG